MDTNLYVVYIPGFRGVHSQGKTWDGLQDNLREVIEMRLEDGNLIFEKLSCFHISDREKPAILYRNFYQLTENFPASLFCYQFNYQDALLILILRNSQKLRNN